MPRTLLRQDALRRQGSQSYPAQEAEAPFAEGEYFDCVCGAGDVVGDFVYVAGAGNTVERCNPTLRARMPAVGVIIAKDGATNCLVHVGPGLVSQSVFGLGALTPGGRYYVGTNGRLRLGPPPDVGVLIQRVGQALDANRLLLIPANSFDLVTDLGEALLHIDGSFVYEGDGDILRKES